VRERRRKLKGVPHTRNWAILLSAPLGGGSHRKGKEGSIMGKASQKHLWVKEREGRKREFLNEKSP